MLMPRIYGENLFDDFFDDFSFLNRDLKKTEKKLYGRKASHVMSTDIKEKEGAYELEMDLPGFSKDEIQISLNKGYLTIQAAKGVDESKDDKEKGCFIRKERYSGACSRSFYVGEDVREEEIRAEFIHGILKLTIPKKEPEKEAEQKKYITIDG